MLSKKCHPSRDMSAGVGWQSCQLDSACPRTRRRKKCARRALVAPWVHSKLEPGVASIGLDRSLGLFAGGYPMKESFEFSIIDFSGFSSYMHLHAPDVQPDLFPARERLLQPCCWSLALLCSRTFLETPVAVKKWARDRCLSCG